MSLTAPPAPAPGITHGAVLGSPYVARLLGGTLTCRLPNGMAPVAITLWATGSGGSSAFGGLLSALYGLSSALAQPVKGCLMDRRGQSTVHRPAGARRRLGPTGHLQRGRHRRPRRRPGTRRPDQGATPFLSNPLRRSIYGRPYAVDRGARMLSPGGS
ncbi:hypothetical protein RKD20_007756 [Streptomyces sp. SLBN-8D4]